MTGLFTIADKRDEAGLAEAAQALGIPLTFLDPAVLALVAGEARSCSHRVEEMFGLPGIAETAALAGAGQGAVLLVPKIATPTVTCAIAGPAPTERTDAFVVEQARDEDVPAIEAMVAAAYRHYVERLGRPPAPMTANYAELVAMDIMHVLRVGGEPVGAISLTRRGDALEADHLVVAPEVQGRGFGRILLAHAEGVARAQGLTAITGYTNARMHENIALYKKLGCVETGRRTEAGFERVFFRKELA